MVEDFLSEEANLLMKKKDKIAAIAWVFLGGEFPSRNFRFPTILTKSKHSECRLLALLLNQLLPSSIMQKHVSYGVMSVRTWKARFALRRGSQFTLEEMAALNCLKRM